MSVSYNVHVGPYIEVFNPDKPSTEEYHTCSNPKCINFEEPLSNKFCPECGTKITLKSIESIGKIQFDVYQEFNDKLYELFGEHPLENRKDYKYFMSNKKGTGGKSFFAYNSVCYDINESIIINDVYVFKTNFSKEIERIEQIFGKENVKIKYGVLAYAS